ncbi:MAG: MerR family transcriptional regulator [Candidatus Tectomicrobia bacterium]|nr:MerR family transcriptional regulator [Candidatus Tectomicrobia bacterium]
MASTIPDKMFFKIGEVADITGIKPHVLRYWESEFKLLKPAKNKSGQRIYRRRDVEVVQQIKQLLYEESYTIAGAKKKIARRFGEEVENGNGADLAVARRVFQEVRGELMEILSILKN